MNDITSDTALLLDEYIGNDDMRKRLQSIMDNVGRIPSSCVKEAGEGPKTILGVPGDAAHTTADPLLEGKRVLVADDEPNIRQTIGDLLTRCGAWSKPPRTARKPSLCSLGSRYDLVLSDIKMPHRNGYEIFAAAARLNQSPPVILMTGFGYDPNHSIVARARRASPRCSSSLSRWSNL